jgi:hypothetical protein
LVQKPQDKDIQFVISAVKATKVTEEEKEKYPIPKQPGKFYEYKMNMETIQHFDEREFIDALEYVGLLG